MNASILYRAAAVCLLLFAVGHTLGFQSAPDPAWGAGPVWDSMHSHHFDIQGSNRSYWDFFLGAGLTVAVLYVFSAILAWQLGSLPAANLAQMRLLVWAFAICFAAVTIVSVRYLFVIPIAFSSVITLLLVAGAWRSAR